MEHIFRSKLAYCKFWATLQNVFLHDSFVSIVASAMKTAEKFDWKGTKGQITNLTYLERRMKKPLLWTKRCPI